MFTWRSTLLQAVLLAAAPASQAIGVGPVEGVPLIGRQLDIGVQLSLDGVDPAASCTRAEVIQGDIPSETANARIETTPAGKTMLRVRTNRIVEEPIVTLVVHTGCFLKTTRRFILLSDLPANTGDMPLQLSQQLPSVPAAGAVGRSAAASSPPVAARQRRQQATPRLAPPDAAPAAAARSPRRSDVAIGAPVVKEPFAAPPRRAAAVTAAKPSSVMRVEPRNRLRLDPIDLAVDPQPNLRLTATIDAVPEISPQRRAEAAAVWKALNRSPVDVMQDFERMQSMSADLTLMRQHMLSNKADLDALRAQLLKSQDDRDRVTWVLSGVIGALLLALVAVLLMRKRDMARGREGGAWWRESSMDELAPSARGKDPALANAAAAGEPPPGDLDVDLSIFGPSEQGPSPSLPTASSSSSSSASKPISAFSHLDFQTSQPASWRSLTTEELHDIQEQADFFVSLGDYDRAVDVLMSHVHASPQNSALAWMALLDLHHRLNRRQGYEGLRDQIERRMNVKVPEFEHYPDATAGLESYADALTRIVTLWPTPRVLDVIEESIYRLPGGAQGEPFELAAFDELLMLYDIGKAVVTETDAPDIELNDDWDGASMREEFPMTSTVPLSAEITGPTDEDMQMLAQLLAGSRIDIDLDEAPPAGFAPDKTLVEKRSNMIEFVDFDSATARLGKN